MDILDATESTVILTLAVQRAKSSYGIRQRELSLKLSCRSPNIIPMWKQDIKTGIPLNQIIPFARLTGMNAQERLHLITVRLDELNGVGTTIDTRAIAMLMEEYAQLGREEAAVLEVLREEKARIGWCAAVFDPENDKSTTLAELRAFMQSLVQREASEAALESSC